MQQETQLEETQMPKIDKWTAVGGARTWENARQLCGGHNKTGNIRGAVKKRAIFLKPLQSTCFRFRGPERPLTFGFVPYCVNAICLLIVIFPGCISPGTFLHPELAQSLWVRTTMTHRDMTSTHLLPMFAFQGCCCSYNLRQLSSVILSIPTHYSCTITIWPFSLWYIH